MRLTIPTLILAFTASISGQAADGGIIEPVNLTKAAVIQLDGKNPVMIDARAINGPVSIVLSHCTNIVISVCDLHSIELSECEHVTIYNCWIHDSTHCGVQLWKCRNVLVQGCRIESVASGVYAMSSQQVRVIGNFIRNMQGPYPRGQAAQFDRATGTNNVIRGNYAINEHDKSHPEDVFSSAMSYGEENSPILIENNYLTGDPLQGSADMSETGSGIMLGDGGGAYVVCRSNVIISAGQEGLGVAGGRFMRVESNLIYGKKSNVTRVGLFIWNQLKQPMDHVTLIGNRVQWTKKDGTENSWWDGGGVQDVEQRDNHFADSSLATNLPAPPSRAPMPPQPCASLNADGASVVRLPWKPE
jgi:hypothetical protein